MTNMVTIVLIAVMTLCGIANCTEMNVYAATKKPKKVTITKKTSTPETITIKWSKAKRAKKYQVQDYDRDIKEWAVFTNKKTKKTSITIKNLEPEKKYTFRIRSINGKKKSKWTKVSFTTKAEPIPATVKVYGSYKETTEKIKTINSTVGKTIALPALEKNINKDGSPYRFEKWSVTGGTLTQNASDIKNSVKVTSENVKATATYKYMGLHLDDTDEPEEPTYTSPFSSVEVINPNNEKIYNHNYLGVFCKTSKTFSCDPTDYATILVSENAKIGDTVNNYTNLAVNSVTCMCEDVKYIADKDGNTPKEGFGTYRTSNGFVMMCSLGNVNAGYKKVAIVDVYTDKIVNITNETIRIYNYETEYAKVKTSIKNNAFENYVRTEKTINCIEDINTPEHKVKAIYRYLETKCYYPATTQTGSTSKYRPGKIFTISTIMTPPEFSETFECSTAADMFASIISDFEGVSVVKVENHNVEYNIDGTVYSCDPTPINNLVLDGINIDYIF